jgi:hypothetical protein
MTIAIPCTLVIATQQAVAGPIQDENARPGTPGWHRPAANPMLVEAYASEVSVQPGGTLNLHVSTAPPASYRIEIYRLGWYDGVGARRLACIPGCTASEMGSPQAVPTFDASAEIKLDWPITDSVVVPPTWPSGVYVAEVVLTSGVENGAADYVPFVVREATDEDSQVLVQLPVNTWQAYNNWGGRSLYAYNSAGGIASTRVSFDRPYASIEDLFAHEYPLIRFLERNGYDVSYTTDTDIDGSPGELLRHRLIISAGHDEYWTKGIRDAFEAARDAGTNLAFLGANIGYWQMRYADSGRTIVEYRSSSLDPIPDPAQKTINFRSLSAPRPECSLMGVEYQGGETSSEASIGNYHPAAQSLLDPWFANTGFTPDTVLPGLVGYEWDAIKPGCETPPLVALFHAQQQPSDADAVRYVASSGARVFSAGSLRFVWGLDDWNGSQYVSGPLQQFMQNALEDMLRPAPPGEAIAALIGSAIELAANVHPDPRVSSIEIHRSEGSGGFAISRQNLVQTCVLQGPCSDRPPGHRTYTYAAVAVDRWGASSPIYTSPIGVPDAPPEVHLIGPRRTGTRRPVTVRASVLDRDGDTLRLVWVVDGRDISKSGRMVTLIFRKSGTHVVRLHADDRHGRTTTAELHITSVRAPKRR